MKTSALAVAFKEVRHFKPDDGLHCESIALRGRAMNWTIPAHRHDALHQFLVLTRGAMTVHLDGVAHPVKAPAMLWVAPGCVHALDFEPDSDGHQVTVPTHTLQAALAQAPTLAMALSTSCVLCGEDALGGAPSVAALAALGERFVQEYESSQPGRQEALQAHLVLWVTWCLRRATPALAAATRRTERDTLVHRYRALIERHWHSGSTLPWSVRVLAGELAVSPDHLSRVCKAVTGQGALDLLHERLMLEARRRLAHSDAAVSVVARELGFDDPSYFSRFFARHAGCSPQGYRQALGA